MKKNNKRFSAGIYLLCTLLLLVSSCRTIKKEKIELDDSVVACWKFDDFKKIGKDSSPAKNDLIIKGAAFSEDGALAIRGGIFRVVLENKDYIHSTSKDFELGNESFTVECWFKTKKVKYDKLVGTRISIRPLYKNLKGWALGLSTGKALFVVNDDKENCSVAEMKLMNSSWDEDVFNYMVGVRDRKSKKLKLYLNGILVSSVDDIAADISSGENLKIGIDEYAGSVTEGILKNIKIQKKVFSAKEIAEQYANKVQKENFKDADIVLKDDVVVPADLKIDRTDGLDGKLNLQPKPQNLDYAQSYTTLKTPVYVQIPKAPTDQERIAEKILISDFLAYLNVNVKRLEVGKNVYSGTVIKLRKSTEKLHSESYKLNVKNSDKVIDVSLSSADHGIIYGVLTLIQIVEQSSLINDLKTSIPVKLTIYDYPEVPRRIRVQAFSRKLTESDEEIHRAMLRITRARLNYHKMSVMEPSLKDLERLIKISKMYGIDTVATEFYTEASRRIKRPYRVSDMKPMLKRFENIAKFGCKGLSFHFDDLGEFKKGSTEFPGGVGAYQRQFLVKIQKLAQENGISFVSVCPTMYMRDWESRAVTWFGPSSNYPDYFKLVSQLPGGDIEVFYTDLAGVKDITKRGVKRPAYYLNGVWGSQKIFGVYAGPNRLTWSWYGFHIDPVKGGVGDSEAMNAWRNIAKNKIETVWVGSGMRDGVAIAGIWLWNPDEFDEGAAIKEVNRKQGLGAGTFNALMDYERNVLPLTVFLKTYINGSTNEFGVKEVKRKHPLNSNDLIAYWKNYQNAEKAYKTCREIIKDTKVHRDYASHLIINRMKKALKLLKKKLIIKLKRNGIAVEK